MKKTLLISLVAFGASAFAADHANAFKIQIPQDSVIEGKNIKAGDYKVTFENGNAMLKQGKQVVEVPAHEESVQNRADVTALIYKDGSNLRGVQIGGTTTRLIFGPAGTVQSGM